MHRLVKLMGWVAVLLVSGAALAASLEAGTWGVESFVNAKGQSLKPLEAAPLTLQFSAGRISGYAGCNSFIGSYTLSGSSLVIKLGGRTLKACAAPIMVQENEFLLALGRVARYTLRDSGVLLQLANGKTLIALSTKNLLTLTGATWELTGLNDGQGAVASPVAGSKISLRFGTDGRVSGSAGCNNFVADYVMTDDSLDISAAAATRKLCTLDGIMAQEKAFLASLETVARFQIEGSSLRLLAEDGATVAVFRAVR